jgi:hypothetical protein
MSVALAVQLTTVPIVDGDRCNGSKSIVIAAFDGELKIVKRKGKKSQQVRMTLNDLIDSPSVTPGIANKKRVGPNVH